MAITAPVSASFVVSPPIKNSVSQKSPPTRWHLQAF